LNLAKTKILVVVSIVFDLGLTIGHDRNAEYRQRARSDIEHRHRRLDHHILLSFRLISGGDVLSNQHSAFQTALDLDECPVHHDESRRFERGVGRVDGSTGYVENKNRNAIRDDAFDSCFSRASAPQSLALQFNFIRVEFVARDSKESSRLAKISIGEIVSCRASERGRGDIAIEHLGFLVLEMFLWNQPFGIRVFGLTPEFAEQSAALAANQGLYNGFLAAGLFWSLLRERDTFANRIFFLGCVVVAGIFGALTVSHAIFVVQAIPAMVALLLVGLSSREAATPLE